VGTTPLTSIQIIMSLKDEKTGRKFWAGASDPRWVSRRAAALLLRADTAHRGDGCASPQI
jgi:hypothetical protein